MTLLADTPLGHPWGLYALGIAFAAVAMWCWFSDT